MIDLKGTDVKVEGPLFGSEAFKTLRRNLYEAVEEVTEKGADYARSMPQPSSQTRAGIEAHVYRRQRLAVLGGGTVGSLYGKVRMKPGLSRSPGSQRYPAARRPYIIAAVHETGHYRGQQRPAYKFFRKATAKARGYVRSIKTNLVRGLT